VQAQHLLDEIRLRLHFRRALGGGLGARQIGGLIQRLRLSDVVTPARHGDGDALRIFGDDAETQPLERGHRFRRRDVHAAEAAQPREAQPRLPPPFRPCPRLGDLARHPAANLHDHGGGGGERLGQDLSVNAAFEPRPRIGDDAGALAGAGNPHAVEQRAFDEHIGGGEIAARGFAASDAGQGLRPRPIGDDAILRPGLHLPPREAGKFIAFPPPAQGQRLSRHLAHVEHVERPAEIVGEEIGDIHERVDRPQADALQPPRQPGRAGPVANPAHGAAQHPGRRLGKLVHPAQGGSSLTLDERGLEGLEPPQTRRREIAGDAAHRQGVAPVGGDGDLDEGIVQPGPGGIIFAHRRVGGQFDDSFMVLSQRQFAIAGEHAFRARAANLPHLQFHAGGGDDGSRRREDRFQAGTGIGRAADDGIFAASRAHAA